MKNKFPLTVLLLLILPGLLSPPLRAAETNIDREIAVLEESLETAAGTERIGILNKLGAVYYSKLPSKCIEYGQMALELCKESGNYRQKGKALTNIAMGYQQMGKQNKALQYLKSALDLFNTHNDTRESAGVMVNLGIVYRSIGDLEKSLEYYQGALKIAVEYNDRKEIALISGNIGNVYFTRDDFVKALEFHTKALNISEEIGDNEGILHALNNIGLIYNLMGNYDKALEYYETALTMAKKAGNTYILASVLNSLGLVYHGKKKDHPKALDYFRQGLEIAKKMGNKRYIAVFMDNTGLVYTALNQFENSIRFHRESLKIKEEIGDKHGILGSLINIASPYIHIKNYSTALSGLNRALSYANELESDKKKSSIYRQFSLLYEKKGNFRKALDFYKRYFETNEKVFNKTNSQQIAEIQTRYDTLKKEKTIESLQNEKLILEKDNEIQRKSRNLMIVGLILVSVIAVFLINKFIYYFSFWKKQKFIGQYRLMEQIGSGGMAKVFKAHNIRNKNNFAAIKILNEEFFNDREYRIRFEKEGNIIDKLDHPNIVNIIERGIVDRKLFIVTELLQGATLRQKIDTEGRIELGVCLHIMTQLTDTIALIHDQKICHRDLKPANIMVIKRGNDENFVKLLDFGLARAKNQTRVTAAGVLLGTISYMAPEQLTGQDFSYKSDIFSLGVIFYEMMTASPAFPGETPTDVMKQILDNQPLPLEEFRTDFPIDVNHMVLRMLAKNPSERPSAADLVEFMHRI